MDSHQLLFRANEIRCGVEVGTPLRGYQLFLMLWLGAEGHRGEALDV